MMRQDASISKANRRKQLAALASVGASLFLTVAKLSAGVMSGSLALISEGAHNTVDIAVSATTFFAVRVADKPADEEHPFGHAKIEAVAALAQTGFLHRARARRRLRGGSAPRRGPDRGRRQWLGVRRDPHFARRRHDALALAHAHRARDQERRARRRRDALLQRSRLFVLRAHRPRREFGSVSSTATRSPHSAWPRSSPLRAIGSAVARSTRSSTPRPRVSRAKCALSSRPRRASSASTSCASGEAAPRSSATSACSSPGPCRSSASPSSRPNSKRRSQSAGPTWR